MARRRGLSSGPEEEPQEDTRLTDATGSECFQQQEGLAEPQAARLSSRMRTQMSPLGLCWVEVAVSVRTGVRSKGNKGGEEKKAENLGNLEEVCLRRGRKRLA